ncbi:hypothetical protein F4677DRAFT_316014 [Hypoxylon crocopeplum]|nr:hypothetical protein F4677DRAFT_316014 [Hypoxylon crocopeplum]
MSDAGQGVSQGGLWAIIWTLSGASTILLAGRLLIRSIILKSFHLDDLFGFLAWALMIACMIISSIEVPISYRYSSIIIGESPMPSLDEFADMTITIRKYNVASSTLFWTSLYCVKVSFMLLYRVVLGISGMYKGAWLGCMIYIVLCYGTCLIGVFGQCGDSRNLFTYEQCMTPYVASLDLKLLWVDFFCNTSSDLILVIFPLPMIWRLNMRTKQKLAVSGVFGLAIITIAFEVVRTVKLYQFTTYLTNLYSYLELLISVLISMLPSYRFLISASDKDREYRRLFWTRVTMRSYHSDSSGYSMDDYRARSGVGESQRRLNTAVLNATTKMGDELATLPKNIV